MNWGEVAGVRSDGASRISLGAVAILFALSVFFMTVDSARAYVYWASDSYTIERAKIDGSHRERSFIKLPEEMGPLVDIAVNRVHIYWATNGGFIGRARIDGTQVKRKFIDTRSPVLNAIALDSKHVYWTTDELDYSLVRANLDGSGIKPRIAATNCSQGCSSPCAMASNGRYVYAMDSPLENLSKKRLFDAPIIRFGIYSGVRTPDLVSGVGYAWVYCGVAANRTSLFWTDGRLDAIVRSNLDGEDTGRLVGGLSEPCGVEIMGESLYWDSGAYLGRASLGGRRVKRRLGRFPDMFCVFAIDSLSSRHRVSR